VFPARAGINRRGRREGREREGVPRTSGDKPATQPIR